MSNRLLNFVPALALLLSSDNCPGGRYCRLER